MAKKTEPNKWRSAGHEGLLEEIATELARKYGKQQPTQSDKSRARELMLERERYKILVIHSNTLESGFLLRELEQQNFSVAGALSLEDAKDMMKEANLCIIEKRLEGEIERLHEIREAYDYEQLPIYVFSDEPKPALLQFVEWMPKPMYPELVRRVSREWQAWRGINFISTLHNPNDALLTDMMLNIDKLRANKDPGLEQVIAYQFKKFIEHAPVDTRRFGVALYFYRTKRESRVELPGVEKISSISTDDVFTIDELSRDSEPYCLKFFNDEQRARVEIAALRELARREREDQGIDFGFRSRINAPQLLFDSVLTYVGKERKEYYIPEKFIRGPMLYTLMPEVVKKARENDQFTVMFRRAVMFVKNAQIAHLQENDLLKLGFTTTDTDYSAKVSENLTQNIRFFRIKYAKELEECLDSCINALYNGHVIESTQYFDYNDTNLMMEIGGNRRSTLADVEKAFLKTLGKDALSSYSYWDVREFTEQRLSKVDFNKIFRKTSIIEDVSHEFSYYDLAPEEQDKVDLHFLLWKKAKRILNEKGQRRNQERLKELSLIKEKIAKIEEGRIQAKEIEDEKRQNADYIRFKKTQPYIQLYRTIRWFGHVLRRYIPEHRQILTYALEQMKGLCGNAYSQLFYGKRGFSLEREIGKYLKRVKNPDRRHFMSAAVFTNERAHETIKKILGPRLDDFVSFANMYSGAHQDLQHDMSHLKYYFKRMHQILDTILQSNSQITGIKLPEVPLVEIDDGGGLKKYLTSILQYQEDARNKGGPHAVACRYLAAKFIQYVVGKLSNENIDYEKLSRAGVKE